MRHIRPVLPALLLALPGLAVVLPASAQAPAPPATTVPASPGASATGAQAKPGQHNVSVLGLGLASCDSYAALRKAGAGDVAGQWLLGFLSGGAAFAGSNYLGATNMADALTLVDHYCTANPHAALAVAALEVAQELEAPIGQAHK